MKHYLTLGILAIFSFVHIVAPAEKAPRTPSPQGAKSYIISPKKGQTLKSPVKVIFGLTGMGVAPAGVKYPNSGHHHLLINTKIPSENVALPASESVRHFGKGQTEVTLKLKPGKHTLQLVLADHLHIPHQPIVKSEAIEITVK